ncbi:LPS assembly lipoprotein LptE [Microvirga sp. 2MCAF38]|uniref:LPS assembly lipoprotein LptE n=1 Tax=Microvirga sp. 2MCAF38 TaxID=3232989 RepID=UPI003F947906
MLSLNLKSLARLTAFAGLTLALSACFRPLYGPTASGESLQSVLASIEVQEINLPDTQAQVGHYLRSELVYDLNGSGVPAPKRYMLNVVYNQTLSTPIVDAVSGTAQAATISAAVNYSLTNLDGSKILASGTARGSASYDRFQQRFASVRAARDAQIRIAKMISEEIKTRLAVAISDDDAKF